MMHTRRRPGEPLPEIDDGIEERTDNPPLIDGDDAVFVASIVLTGTAMVCAIIVALGAAIGCAVGLALLLIRAIGG